MSRQMNETTKLRAKLERDLMAIDQKIERQDGIIREADEARADLFVSRAMLMAAMTPVREAAE